MTIINYDYYPFLENWDHLGNSATLIWTGDPQTIADHPNVTNHKNLYPNTQIEYRKVDSSTHRWHAPLHDSPNQYFYVEIYSGCAFEYFPFDGWTGSWFEKIKNNEVHLFIQINEKFEKDAIDLQRIDSETKELGLQKEFLDAVYKAELEDQNNK